MDFLGLYLYMGKSSTIMTVHSINKRELNFTLCPCSIDPTRTRDNREAENEGLIIPSDKVVCIASGAA